MNPLFGVLEIAVNRYLSIEPLAVAECCRLQGYTLAVTFSDHDRDICFIPDATGLQVTDVVPDPPTAHVTGTSSDFVRLLTAGENRHAELASGRIQVDGDAAFADRFLRLLESVKPDLEELLEPLTGDLLAVSLGRGIRDVSRCGQRDASSMVRNLSACLQGDGRSRVGRAEMARWKQGVDEVSKGAGRLEARLVRLRGMAGESA